MKHLLVTNDFPPKVGGIQNYLWELWRRLPAEDVVVFTSKHRDSAAFDAEQPFQIIRHTKSVLLPTPSVAKRINELAKQVGAEFVLLDPALPLGAVAKHLDLPYGIVVHGAEFVLPSKVPLLRRRLAKVMDGASVVIAAGTYVADSVRQLIGNDVPVVNVPPGVDCEIFVPFSTDQRNEWRRQNGFDPNAPLIVGTSRLVPRKGFDDLITASAQLARRYPTLQVAIAGAGRDLRRLQRKARRQGAPVTFMGRIPQEKLLGLMASADVFAMLCRSRWFGLEQEGFGIVFLEAAACGVPTIVGHSGGSSEAVIDGETGIVVDRNQQGVIAALDRYLSDENVRSQHGRNGRQWVTTSATYALRATELQAGLDAYGKRT